MIKFVDWFAGIGGFRRGLEEASPRFVCVGTCEIDKYARQVYANHWNEPEWSDSYEADPADIPDFDLFCAGFPCQSFSIAGKRGGLGECRGQLFFEVVRIIGAKRPSYILLENVKGLLSSEEGRDYLLIKDTLGKLGYITERQTLNSKDFGVPQNRERVFIVGHLGGRSRPEVFPVGEDGRTHDEGEVENDKADKGITVWQKTSGMTVTTKTDETGCLQYGGCNVSDKIPMIIDRNGLREITKGADQASRIYDPEGLSPTLPTPSGGRHIPKIAQCVRSEHPSIKRTIDMTPSGGQRGRVYDPSGVSPSLYRANDGGSHSPAITADYPEISNSLDADGYLRTGARPRDKDGKTMLLPIGHCRIRRLTPVECERLQGYPDNWTEKGLTGVQFRCNVPYENRRYICDRFAELRDVVEKLYQEKTEFASCTIRDYGKGERQINISRQRENVNIVEMMQLQEVSATNTISLGSGMVTLCNQKGIYNNADSIRWNLTQEKTEKKSILPLWRIAFKENYSEEKLSTILTWIKEITDYPIFICAKTGEPITNVIIHWNSLQSNYINKESFNLEMAGTVSMSDTQRYKCLGNAVTVNVIRAIGEKFIRSVEP